MLNDAFNLEILENICSGTGVEINVSSLSKSLKKHRNTIKTHLKELFDNRIINKPIYPFMWLFQEYPLLVAAKADLPRSKEIDTFLREDQHVFGVFYVRDESYNTLIIQFHKDIHAYGEWRRMIVEERKIPPREYRYPSESYFFSAKQFIKYQPNCPVYLIEEKIKNMEHLDINGYRMTPLSFQIMKKLMLGEGIRTNENTLAEILDAHRKTIERRVAVLLREKIVAAPVCRFPKFFVPPEHVLVFCMCEIMDSKDKIINALKTDNHIPMAMDANIGRYNIMLFKVFSNVEEHFIWEESYDKRFPDCIGDMRKMFLSPQMTASIDQQKVSLGIIRQKKEMLRGRELIETVR